MTALCLRYFGDSALKRTNEAAGSALLYAISGIPLLSVQMKLQDQRCCTLLGKCSYTAYTRQVLIYAILEALLLSVHPSDIAVRYFANNII